MAKTLGDACLEDGCEGLSHTVGCNCATHKSRNTIKADTALLVLLERVKPGALPLVTCQEHRVFRLDVALSFC